MKIIYRDVGTIKPYEKNSRHHPPEQIEALAKAIKEFGFDQPIVIDIHGVIIKGHGRLEAAKLAGMTKVPCIIKVMPENEAKLLRVADNEVVSGAWDYHALALELETLNTSGVDLMEATGFSVGALNDLPEAVQEAVSKTSTISVVAPKRVCNHCGYKF